MSTFVSKTSFQFKEWYSESLVQQRFSIVHKTKHACKTESRKVYFRTAIKFSYSLALTWKVDHENDSSQAKRPKTSLKIWNSSKLSFFPALSPAPHPLRFPTAITFLRVKKSPLINWFTSSPPYHKDQFAVSYFSTSCYWTDPGLQLADPVPLIALSLWTCWYFIYYHSASQRCQIARFDIFYICFVYFAAIASYG